MVSHVNSGVGKECLVVCQIFIWQVGAMSALKVNEHGLHAAGVHLLPGWKLCIRCTLQIRPCSAQEFFTVSMCTSEMVQTSAGQTGKHECPSH